MGVSVMASVCAQASELEFENPHVTAGPQTTTIADVPPERMVGIFSYLSAADIAKMCRVCKTWNDILETEHGKAFTHSNTLYTPTHLEDASAIPDEEMTKTLAFHIKHGGFAPLENVFISPHLYPPGTRLLEANDLEASPDTVSTWYTALFGSTPQDEHALALVMSALPRILVQDIMSEETLTHMTSYVEKVGKRTRFMRFTGLETDQEKEALSTSPHTLVVRSDDLQAHQEALASLLDAHADHRVILCFDGDAFIQNGTLSMSKENIPDNLRHLTLADPLGKVSAIGDDFLKESSSLVSFGAKDLRRLEVIGQTFLGGCENLRSFDTRGFSSLKMLKWRFLANCTSLRSFDTLGFVEVERIGSECLSRCTSLASFNTRGFKKVQRIGADFLATCPNLAFINTVGLTNLESISWRFLANSRSLTSIDLDPLAHVKEVAHPFLEHTNLSMDDQEKVEAFLKRVNYVIPLVATIEWVH